MSSSKKPTTTTTSSSSSDGTNTISNTKNLSKVNSSSSSNDLNHSHNIVIDNNCEFYTGTPGLRLKINSTKDCSCSIEFSQDSGSEKVTYHQNSNKSYDIYQKTLTKKVGTTAKFTVKIGEKESYTYIVTLKKKTSYGRSFWYWDYNKMKSMKN